MDLLVYFTRCIKFKYDSINYFILNTMLASNKGMGRSMASTRSSQSTKNNRKEGFVAYIFNRMMAWVSYFYSKSKSFLWVGSTGTSFQ